MITAKILRAIAPRANPAFVDELAKALDDELPLHGLDTPLRQAHFLAQAAHETDGFRTLLEYWGPTEAQRRYEGREDLGNVKRGDGKRYLGRGIFQLTGRANYKRYGKLLGLALEAKPELAAQPENAVAIAIAYWNGKSLSEAADADDILTITRRINGGLNGLADRRKYLARAKLALMPQRRAGLADIGGEARPEPAAPLEVSTAVPAGDVDRAAAAEPRAAEDPLIGPNSPERLVQALQEALNQRNYDCGAENGDFGSLTRSAVLSLKANEGLDTSTATIRMSEVEAAGPWIIPGRQDKTVRDRLKAGDESIGFTAKVKRWIWGVLGFFGIGGTATAVKDGGDAGGTTVLDKADQALGLWERVGDVAAPVANLFLGALHWLWLPVIVALLVAWWLSNRAQRKRLEDYKNARMVS